MIVDDVPLNARLLEAKLAAEYYETACAADGPMALALADDWQPDLILLDIMMPGIDGYEACERLKANPRTAHIPIVMVTALSEPCERVRGLEAGADDFISKPVEYDTLMARIRGLVRLKRLLDEWRARTETMRALGFAGDPRSAPAIAGAKVLIIDDWDVGAANLIDALHREDLAITRIKRAGEADAILSAENYHLVVISLSLVDDDALRLVARVRAEERTRNTPLLLVAECDQRQRLLQALDIGGNDWVARPVDAYELRLRARNQIRRKIYQDRLSADLGEALNLALVDPLTGLHNMRYLAWHLRTIMVVSHPPGIAVILLDIDHFKSINDRFGHATGDRALRLIAETLRTDLRGFDTIARYGGEEFVIVMPGTTLGDAMTIAERLRRTVEALHFKCDNALDVCLTVSAGVATSECSGGGMDDLLNAADRALYEAKRDGRNRVTAARPLPVSVT
jgi:two-component system cell cycle response regulator